MAMVIDIVMVHYMTVAGAPMSQADVLNLSLPSASLALGTAATVLAAHQQHHLKRPTADGIETPIGELGWSDRDRINRSNGDLLERSSDNIPETCTDNRWSERRQSLLELP